MITPFKDRKKTTHTHITMITYSKKTANVAKNITL